MVNQKGDFRFDASKAIDLTPKPPQAPKHIQALVAINGWREKIKLLLAECNDAIDALTGFGKTHDALHDYRTMLDAAQSQVGKIHARVLARCSEDIKTQVVARTSQIIDLEKLCDELTS